MRHRLALTTAALLACAGGSAAAAPHQEAVARSGDAVTVEGRTGSCTLGFLFRGSDGAAYASTAGHCVLGDEKVRRTWPTDRGPLLFVQGPEGPAPIGKVVFAEYLPTDDNDKLDFALVRLRPGVAADPEIGELGVPRKVYGSQGNEPVLMAFHGQGAVTGQVDPERELVATNTSRITHVYAHGVATPGDSGAPVVTADGDAVGLLLGVGGNGVAVGMGTASVGHDGALTRIGRLGPLVEHAAAALRLRLRLLTR